MGSTGQWRTVRGRKVYFGKAGGGGEGLTGKAAVAAYHADQKGTAAPTKKAAKKRSSRKASGDTDGAAVPKPAAKKRAKKAAAAEASGVSAPKPAKKRAKKVAAVTAGPARATGKAVAGVGPARPAKKTAKKATKKVAKKVVKAESKADGEAKPPKKATKARVKKVSEKLAAKKSEPDVPEADLDRARKAADARWQGGSLYRDYDGTHTEALKRLEADGWVVHASAGDDGDVKAWTWGPKATSSGAVMARHHWGQDPAPKMRTDEPSSVSKAPAESKPKRVRAAKAKPAAGTEGAPVKKPRVSAAVAQKIANLTEESEGNIRKLADEGNQTAKRFVRAIDAIGGRQGALKAIGTTDPKSGVNWDLRTAAKGGESFLQRGRMVAWVDVKKLDAQWTDKRFRVEDSGAGEISGRMDNFRQFQKTGRPIKPSYVHMDKDGGVSFTNGRHRFAVMRADGVERVPVIVDRKNLKDFEARGVLTDPPEGVAAPRRATKGDLAKVKEPKPKVERKPRTKSDLEKVKAGRARGAV